ncbi:MAG: hypothetical protein A2259_00370 [Candidatus Moranbacteria bacterium RIFOXYA2_FULL_43_15]|nr:MAG: hypothetical protein A2259_00370 [Candidatus Moranbacteria bacterium RIFOXYA2_FULL_43_15]
MSEILESLFGSKEKARLLRFFLQNPESVYEFGEIVRRNMIKGNRAKRELLSFVRIKLVQKRTKQGKNYYQLNQNFQYYPELKNLIAKSNVYPQCQSLGKISKIGHIKFAAISGVFISYPKSKADMILVAEGVSKARLKNLMESLEAEIGKEINFVLMTMEEFKYRLNMLDKFILEFLEGPHEELINKISGLKRFIAQRKL